MLKKKKKSHTYQSMVFGAFFPQPLFFLQLQPLHATILDLGAGWDFLMNHSWLLLRMCKIAWHSETGPAAPWNVWGVLGGCGPEWEQD